MTVPRLLQLARTGDGKKTLTIPWLSCVQPSSRTRVDDMVNDFQR